MSAGQASPLIDFLVTDLYLALSPSISNRGVHTFKVRMDDPTAGMGDCPSFEFSDALTVAYPWKCRKDRAIGRKGFWKVSGDFPVDSETALKILAIELRLCNALMGHRTSTPGAEGSLFTEKITADTLHKEHFMNSITSPTTQFAIGLNLKNLPVWIQRLRGGPALPATTSELHHIEAGTRLVGTMVPSSMWGRIDDTTGRPLVGINWVFTSVARLAPPSPEDLVPRFLGAKQLTSTEHDKPIYRPGAFMKLTTPPQWDEVLNHDSKLFKDRFLYLNNFPILNFTESRADGPVQSRVVKGYTFKTLQVDLTDLTDHILCFAKFEQEVVKKLNLTSYGLRIKGQQEPDADIIAKNTNLGRVFKSALYTHEDHRGNEICTMELQVTDHKHILNTEVFLRKAASAGSEVRLTQPGQLSDIRRGSLVTYQIKLENLFVQINQTTGEITRVQPKWVAVQIMVDNEKAGALDSPVKRKRITSLAQFDPMPPMTRPTLKRASTIRLGSE